MASDFSVVYRAPTDDIVKQQHTCKPDSGQDDTGRRLTHGSICECNVCGRGWWIEMWVSSDNRNYPSLYGRYSYKWRPIRWYNYNMKRRMVHGQ